MSDHWNPRTYDDKHDFVWQLGAGVLELLHPKAGEIILDPGCGTGHLTAQIARSHALAIGFDPSLNMLETARRAYPHLDFRQADGRDFDFPERFDAVFSNAALHWIHEPEAVIARVFHHLKSGGRFVVEFGGKGNVAALDRALGEAAQKLGLPPFCALNYFPSVGQYASLLEQVGFEVRFATLFNRPTPLNGEHGARNWLRQFRAVYLDSLEPAASMAVLDEAENFLRPILYKDDAWFADYRRWQFSAFKSQETCSGKSGQSLDRTAGLTGSSFR